MSEEPINFRDASGNPVRVSVTNPLPVALFEAGADQTEYETVAASQTAQVMGGTGATGDYLTGVLVIPTTTSPGAVTILDGATSIVIFNGGAVSLTELRPFYVQLGIKSVSGPWKITTGANVAAIGIGNFAV